MSARKGGHFQGTASRASLYDVLASVRVFVPKRMIVEWTPEMKKSAERWATTQAEVQRTGIQRSSHFIPPFLCPYLARSGESAKAVARRVKEEDERIAKVHDIRSRTQS